MTDELVFTADGFSIPYQNQLCKVKWADIETLVAYKADFITFDEICLDIVYGNHIITITEETNGWHLFLQKMIAAFPLIDNNWEALVLQPPVAENHTVIYKRPPFPSNSL